MAKGPLTEDKIREVKADLMERVTNQQEVFGCDRDTRRAEDFINPILHKLDVDSREEKPEPPPPSPVVRNERRDLGNGAELTKEEVGTYDWNLRTNKVQAAPGSFMPSRRKRKEHVETIAARHRVKFLKGLPEWRAKMETIFFAVQPQAWKEQELLLLLDESSRLFGDWRKPRAQNITVFGKNVTSR